MLSGLKEGQEKMSKSDPDSAIFMEDTAGNDGDHDDANDDVDDDPDVDVIMIKMIMMMLMIMMLIMFNGDHDDQYTMTWIRGSGDTSDLNLISHI